MRPNRSPPTDDGPRLLVLPLFAWLKDRGAPIRHDVNDRVTPPQGAG